MKKTLMILGGVFLVLVIIGAIGIGILAVKGSALDKESKAYVDRVTPIILADLNQKTLFKYADEELKKSVSAEDFKKIFKFFGRLGKFKKYEGSTGQANISVTTTSGKVITGRYAANAEFEKGPATVRITVIKRNTGWKILGFYINSKAFLPRN